MNQLNWSTKLDYRRCLGKTKTLPKTTQQKLVETQLHNKNLANTHIHIAHTIKSS